MFRKSTILIITKDSHGRAFRQVVRIVCAFLVDMNYEGIRRVINVFSLKDAG